MDKNDTSLIKEINKLVLKKGDVLVVKMHMAVALDVMDRISTQVKGVLKRAGMAEVPVLILSDDMDIKVISKE